MTSDEATRRREGDEATRRRGVDRWSASSQEAGGAARRTVEALRRTAAVASQFEMHARTRESETQVVAAKSVVPTAAAAAVRHNNFGRRHAMPATINNRIRWKLATV